MGEVGSETRVLLAGAGALTGCRRGLALRSGAWICSGRPALGFRARIALASREHSRVSDVTC